MKNLLLITLAALGLTAESIAQNLPNYIPANGLVGWWPFNGNANDESGNGNNATVSGASLANDRFGNQNKAFSFDGANDYLEILHHPSINLPNGTINLWFKTSSNNRMTLFNKANFNDATNENYNATLGYLFTPSGPTGIAYFSKYNSNCLPYVGWIGNQNSLNFSDGNYHMLTCITAATAIEIFIDGLLQSSITSPSTLADTCPNSNLRIGQNWAGDLNSYLGDLDDIGMWNRALTQQEITDLYNGNICYQTITVTDTLLINMGITGFNPVTYNNTIKIFPNPANNHITIDYGNFATMNGYQLKIENSLGQELFQTNITQQTDYLSLNNWGGNGLYFVHIIDTQGNTIDIRKIVLQ